MHNEFVELGLSNWEIKNVSSDEERKMIIRELISDFCSEKLWITKEEAMESIIRFESSDY